MTPPSLPPPLPAAIALHQGTVGELVTSLQQQLSEHEAAKPVASRD